MSSTPNRPRLLTALLMILCVAGVSVAAVSFLSACKSSGRH